MHYLRAIIAVV